MPADRPTRSDALDPQDLGLLTDLLRGELAPEAAGALEARLAAEPELAQAHERLARLFELEQGRFEADERAAAADAPRLARYIVSRVRSDEAAEAARSRAVAGTRRRWARILAVSIGLHVVVLGLLAWQLSESRRADRGASIDVAYEPGADTWDRIPEEALAERLGRVLGEMSPEDLADLPEDVLRFDGALDELIEPQLEDVVRKAGDGPSFLFPPGTGLALSRRSNEALKRQRLAALGFDADGTLNKVRLGLSYLQGKQQKDGAFPASAGRSAVYETSVALLAFLGDGRHSKLEDDAGTVVRRGVRWLRAQAFDAEGRVVDAIDGLDLGVTLAALAEDYMLSYGRLGMAEARHRGEEIARLADVVRDVEARIVATKAPDRETTLWPLWALHAAERTGVIERSPVQRERFEVWVAAASDGEGPGQAWDTVQVLTRGTALLSLERGASKPRFRAFGEATAEELLGRLLPNGKAKGEGSGDRVAETALTLLALQTAYRAF
ncbi:MAG: hypothetical protein QNJ98_17180 [Planctomycetota bacterium]|nr:hypothetical protein [Planctomycetota bacterium]